MSRLVLEVGTEAIPAGFLPPALTALAAGAQEGLAALRLTTERIHTSGTPNRLVLEVHGLVERQADLEREVQGPRVDIAFRDGSPTPAAEGFARKNGVAVEKLERVVSAKGEFVVARVHEVGRPAAEVVPPFLGRLVEGISWPKTMVWNKSRYRFPRPIRWVLCLLGDQVLALELAGLSADRTTRGHRLLGPGKVSVAGAEDFGATLAQTGVVLDPEERRRRIQEVLESEAAGLGGRVVSDPGLLEEVVFLTEHPHVLSGAFDAEFLQLPREIVVTAMRSHQRYFAVESDESELQPYFLVVTDGEWDDPSPVVAGNERVLRARLADARFYWDVDLKTGLDGLAQDLGRVVWLETLGSLAEKADRVTRLVDRLGRWWYAKEWADLRDAALRAARLAKADLASEMIKDGKEFTGLQGTVGARYAEAQGESPALVQALVEQYLPRGAGDPLPESPAGTVLAVADRVDTIAGCWAAGFVPSGSQDPYGLRRAANGIVWVLLEKELHSSLGKLVSVTVEQLPPGAAREGLGEGVLAFLRDRIDWALRERGIPYDVVDAVLTADADDPLDALIRAQALQSIRGEEDLERLVIAFKRAANILKGIDEGELPDPDGIDWSRAHQTERELHQTVARVREGLVQAGESKDYPAMLRYLLELRAPIDRFFDDVLVMSEDDEERNRRLALLAEARELFHHLFDPALIVIEGENAVS